MTRFLLPLLSLLLACSSDPAPAPRCVSPETAALGLTRYAITDTADGVGWVREGDLDGDGKMDLVVSRLGPVDVADGRVTLSPARITAYLQGDELACWTEVPIVAEAQDDEGLYFPNEPNLRDMDGDGDLDVVIPFGFFVCEFDRDVGPCGALVWWENLGTGRRYRRHDILGPNHERFFHRALFADLDGDGLEDLVTVGETQTGGTAMWLRANGSDGGFETPREMGAMGGSLPVLFDIDGDGDVDLASGEFFGTERSFAWLEQVTAPDGTSAGVWEDHTIDDEVGPTIQFHIVPDLFGDGVTRAIGSNHVNTVAHPEEPESGLYLYEIPEDPTQPWPRTRITEGVVSRPNEGVAVRHAPGVFGVGDMDDDGDLDIALSGDGDERTFLLEQTSPGVFTQRVLEASNGQAGGARIVDLDGDGRSETVFTGYERDTVFVYAR